MHLSFLILGFTCDSSFMCKFSVNQVQRKFLRPYQIWHQLHFLLRDGQLGQLVELTHNNGPSSWYSILLKASILFQSPLLNKRYSWFCFISVSFQSKFESHYVNEALLFDFVLYFNHTGMLLIQCLGFLGFWHLLGNMYCKNGRGITFSNFETEHCISSGCV